MKAQYNGVKGPGAQLMNNSGQQLLRNRVRFWICFWLLVLVTMLPQTLWAQDQWQPNVVARYTLGPGDIIRVSVWEQPDLSLNIPVAPDGTISYPLIGMIKASGRTIEDLDNEFKKRMNFHMKGAQVTVSLLEVKNYKIYVLGEVLNPGELFLNGPIYVTQALAMASGFTPFASRNDIIVVRTTASGERRFSFNYQAYISGKEGMENIILYPGDTVIAK